MIPQFSPAAAAPPKTSRLALKNWRVRSRLLLLVLLPTLAAVILGGVSVVSSARSALAYQRVEQFSPGWGAVHQPDPGAPGRTRGHDPVHHDGPGRRPGVAAAAAGPHLAVLAQDRQATDQLARRVRSGAVTIGRSYPALAQQEAKGAITAIGGLPALRSVATSTRIPSLAVIQEYAATITQLLALEDEIATGSHDAVLADTARVVGLISASKEQVSQEQAILTSALTPDLVGANQFQPGSWPRSTPRRRSSRLTWPSSASRPPAASVTCTTATCRPRRRIARRPRYSRPSRWRRAAARRRRTRPSPTRPAVPPTWCPACTRSSRA